MHPETITLVLTSHCNLRCRMCGQWGENGSFLSYTRDQLRESLPLDVLMRLVDGVADFRPTLTLFGGEPLLYRDLVPLVRYAASRGLRTNMITNASGLAGKADDLVEAGLREIIVSVDGPEKVHDEIRGQDGSFRRAMEGVDAVRAARARRMGRYPVIHLNSTLNPENVDCLEDTIRVAERSEVESITFHHPVYLGPGVYEVHREVFGSSFGEVSPDWGGFVREAPPRIDAAKLLEQMRAIRKRRYRVPVFFYPNYEESEIGRYYAEPWFNPLSYSHSCASPWLQCYIFPDGTVRACESMNLSFGNIRLEAFEAIWNNEAYVRFRRDLKERGEYPACNKCTEYYRF